MFIQQLMLLKVYDIKRKMHISFHKFFSWKSVISIYGLELFTLLS